jgi:hypothetical protein
VNRPVVAKAHHFGDAAGVVSIGFDRPRGKESLSVPRLDAHDRYAGFSQSTMQPFQQRAGLDPGEVDCAGPLREPNY